jgi:single-strand DNA-binding protein
MGLNRMELIGNLGQDPEVRHTGSGMAVCELSIAVNERVKKGDQWESHTEWIRCVVFGKRAENVAKFLSKGSQVYIEGKWRTEKWEKDGVTRYTTKVLVDDVQFLDGKKDGASRGGQHGGGGSADYESQRKTGWAGTTEPASDYGTPNREGLDDDIPF